MVDHLSEKALLLVNLGSPDSYKISDVRRYLDEFLMDPYVIDAPFLLRYFIVKATILPFRPKESAEAYESIWWDEGSPLIVLSKQLQEAVQNQVSYPVGLGMRYGSLSIKDAICKLRTNYTNLKELVVLPLYPHYAMASTLTVIEKTRKVISELALDLKVSYIESFFDYGPYIDALTASIKPYFSNDEGSHLLFSYHGVPERHVKKTDPTQSHCFGNKDCCRVSSKAHRFCYPHHVKKTTALVTRSLELKETDWSLSFQSRLGRDPWLKPYTDYVLVELAEKGIKHLKVVCPAFVSDCLETIEEIGMRGKEDFLNAGGESFELIPCLNIHEMWVDAIKQLMETSSLHLKL